MADGCPKLQRYQLFLQENLARLATAMDLEAPTFVLPKYHPLTLFSLYWSKMHKLEGPILRALWTEILTTQPTIPPILQIRLATKLGRIHDEPEHRSWDSLLHRLLAPPPEIPSRAQYERWPPRRRESLMQSFCLYRYHLLTQLATHMSKPSPQQESILLHFTMVLALWHYSNNPPPPLIYLSRNQYLKLFKVSLEHLQFHLREANLWDEFTHQLVGQLLRQTLQHLKDGSSSISGETVETDGGETDGGSTGGSIGGSL